MLHVILTHELSSASVGTTAQMQLRIQNCMFLCIVCREATAVLNALQLMQAGATDSFTKFRKLTVLQGWFQTQQLASKDCMWPSESGSPMEEVRTRRLPKNVMSP